MKRNFMVLLLFATVAFGQANKAALMKPANLKERAPDIFTVRFDTSDGPIVIEVHAQWAPNGADRFYNLVKNGYYEQCRFFRVLPGFVVQFGINGDPGIQQFWQNATIPDDKVTQGNTRGYVSFAKNSAPNSRTTQVFINLADNSRLNRDGFAPFGKVISGMEVVDKIFSGYGQGPNQSYIEHEGNAFLLKNFAQMDYIKKATIIK